MRTGKCKGWLLQQVHCSDGRTPGGVGGSVYRTVIGLIEADIPETRDLCGLRCVGALLSKTHESSQVPVLPSPGRRLVPEQDGGGAKLFQALASLFQSSSDGVGNARHGELVPLGSVGSLDRETEFSPPVMQCWHLIVAAEDRARGEFMTRTITKIKLDIDKGGTPPLGWLEAKPWNVAWQQVLADKIYWTEQVTVPALTWVARGEKGVPKTPLEEQAGDVLRGGAESLRPEFEKGNTSSDVNVVKKNHNKQRREARKKRILQEREELKQLRGKGKGKGDGKDGGRKGSGDGRSSGSSSEACYAWNNGNGLCGGLPPGEKCLGKIPRVDHRCTMHLEEVKVTMALALMAMRRLAGSGEPPSSSAEAEAKLVRETTGKVDHRGMSFERRSTKRKKFTGDDPPGDGDPPKKVIHVEGKFLTVEEYFQKGCLYSCTTSAARRTTSLRQSRRRRRKEVLESTLLRVIRWALARTCRRLTRLVTTSFQLKGET